MLDSKKTIAQKLVLGAEKMMKLQLLELLFRVPSTIRTLKSELRQKIEKIDLALGVKALTLAQFLLLLL